ncbi:hypothetical protein CRG98_032124 [Punica granatum]|uniref:Uncharacterized protein n=1 Tax=Punica granatum TaxID=22663 RepID=A0A2I0IU64_PUNGR|nr:hypothetical protein CRG98_032124 [Punica granatum]
MHEAVARMDTKEAIWRNKEMSEIVDGYFENSLRTLDFCTELVRSLKHAKDRQLNTLLALQRPEEDHLGIYNHGQEAEKNRNIYLRTLEELQKSKEDGSPFTEELFQILLAVYESHTKMLEFEWLTNRKLKLQKKLRSVRSWRKVTSMIFVTTSAAVVICSVAVAASGAASQMAAGAALQVVAGLSAATANHPINSVGNWSLDCGESGQCVALKDLKTVGLFMGKLDKELKSLVEIADSIVDLLVSINKDMKSLIEIKKQVREFMECVDELGVQADWCSHKIRRARVVVLQISIITRNGDYNKGFLNDFNNCLQLMFIYRWNSKINNS